MLKTRSSNAKTKEEAEAVAPPSKTLRRTANRNIIEFEINHLPSMTNRLATMHWAKRMRENQLFMAHMIALIPTKYRNKKYESVERITYTRHSSQRPDHDGLVSSFKGIQDSLVKLGILIDDNPSVIKQAEYYWEKAKRNEGRVSVKIEL